MYLQTPIYMLKTLQPSHLSLVLTKLGAAHCQTQLRHICTALSSCSAGFDLNQHSHVTVLDPRRTCQTTVLIPIDTHLKSAHLRNSTPQTFVQIEPSAKPAARQVQKAPHTKNQLNFLPTHIHTLSKNPQTCLAKSPISSSSSRSRGGRMPHVSCTAHTRNFPKSPRNHENEKRRDTNTTR